MICGLFGASALNKAIEKKYALYFMFYVNCKALLLPKKETSSSVRIPIYTLFCLLLLPGDLCSCWAALRPKKSPTQVPLMFK